MGQKLYRDGDTYDHSLQLLYRQFLVALNLPSSFHEMIFILVPLFSSQFVACVFDREHFAYKYGNPGIRVYICINLYREASIYIQHLGSVTYANKHFHPPEIRKGLPTKSQPPQNTFQLTKGE